MPRKQGDLGTDHFTPSNAKNIYLGCAQIPSHLITGHDRDELVEGCWFEKRARRDFRSQHQKANGHGLENARCRFGQKGANITAVEPRRSKGQPQFYRRRRGCRTVSASQYMAFFSPVFSSLLSGTRSSPPLLALAFSRLCGLDSDCPVIEPDQQCQYYISLEFPLQLTLLLQRFIEHPQTRRPLSCS